MMSGSTLGGLRSDSHSLPMGSQALAHLQASSYVTNENSIVYAERQQDEDDVVLDCRDVVYEIGKTGKRQVHALNLRSAYEYYCSAGMVILTLGL